MSGYGNVGWGIMKKAAELGAKVTYFAGPDGYIHDPVKLSDRIYKCECGYVADRDYNASLNLRDAKTYNIA